MQNTSRGAHRGMGRSIYRDLPQSSRYPDTLNHPPPPPDVQSDQCESEPGSDRTVVPPAQAAPPGNQTINAARTLADMHFPAYVKEVAPSTQSVEPKSNVPISVPQHYTSKVPSSPRPPPTEMPDQQPQAEKPPKASGSRRPKARHPNGTYSVVENQTYFPYYGVGPEPRGDEGKEIHLWYQWVPFYLTFLAVTYYSGHFFWKKMFEKNTMKSIVVGMELLKYSLCDKKIGEVPSAKEREENLNVLAKHIFNRIKSNVNRSWTLWLLVIEVYNLIHAAFAIYLTDVFLGGHGSFVSLTLATAPEVFPTMTKCKFHKYGPSGSIQVHDALCVLAINIVNEKFFYILHWWMPFVLLMCVLCLLWRFLCLILYRNPKFNKMIFREGRAAQLDDEDKTLILQTINFWDWVFLTYLASNMSGLAFRGFFSSLADCIRNDVGTDDDVSVDDGKPLLYNSVESERIKDE